MKLMATTQPTTPHKHFPLVDSRAHLSQNRIFYSDFLQKIFIFEKIGKVGNPSCPGLEKDDNDLLRINAGGFEAMNEARREPLLKLHLAPSKLLHLIQKTSDGSPVLPGYSYPYLHNAIGPDHLLGCNEQCPLQACHNQSFTI